MNAGTILTESNRSLAEMTFARAAQAKNIRSVAAVDSALQKLRTIFTISLFRISSIKTSRTGSPPHAATKYSNQSITHDLPGRKRSDRQDHQYLLQARIKHRAK